MIEKAERSLKEPVKGPVSWHLPGDDFRSQLGEGTQSLPHLRYPLCSHSASLRGA